MTLVERKLLAVGITGYTPKLIGPDNDARAIAEALKSRGRFTIERPGRDDHGSDRLRARIEGFLEDLGPRDLAVLFFAGHADRDSRQRLRLMPRNIDDPEQGLRVDHLLRAAENAGFVWFVFDCCHAAAAIEPAIEAPRDGSVAIIAACGKASAARTRGEHGVLTRGILDAFDRGITEVGAVMTHAREHCEREGQAAVSFSYHATSTVHLIDPPVGALAPPTIDPVAAYRRALRAAHARLLPFVSRGGSKSLSTQQVVELDVDPCEAAFERRAEALRPGPSALTLRGLMELPRRDTGTANRWAVLGDPGAGKSTLARHVAFELADESTADAPLPVLLSVERLLSAGDHPFAIAASAIEAPHGSGAAAALTARLHTLAKLPDRVWLLVDGLDEVTRLDAAVARLRTLATELPEVTLVVLSRPVGYPEAQLSDVFTPARVRRLDARKQRALLEAWLSPAGAAAVLRRIHAQRRLIELATNPLMLTLLARLALPDADAGEIEQTRALPHSRAELYDQTIDLLLKRGHGGPRGRGVKDPSAARPLLRALSLRLTEAGGEAWHLPELTDAAWAARRADDDVNFRCKNTWESTEAALWDIGHNSGVIATHDGPTERWRYLHRSLKERLAADALAAAGREAVDALLQALVEQGDDDSEGGALGRWGETLGMACGLLGDPLPVLETLREASPRLAVRVLLDAEAVPLADALRFLWRIDPFADAEPHQPWWDGDTLLALAIGRREAAELLWARVTAVRSVIELAWLHYALSGVEGAVPRQRFFEACDRWPEGGPPEPDLVEIPEGELWMGTSAEERRTLPGDLEKAAQNSERRHRVTLTRPYLLGRCPVTVDEYRSFDPSHPAGESSHPIANVTWWHARLYAAWVGCVLPTEAQWERACRADTETKYWSGDEEADLARVGWFDGNSVGQTHPVGEKPANPFGLYDMHGNVFEWCADWFEAYPPGPAEDPLGPPAGAHRVLRGGSYWYLADYCRSANRSWSWPGNRSRAVGFRLARPAPAP